MKTLLVLALSLVATATAQTRMVEKAKPASQSEVSRFKFALQAYDAQATSSIAVTSHVAMVATNGNPWNDTALNLTAVIHTRIPARSLMGLRIRRYDGTTYLDGVAQWDRDIEVGESFGLKSPGGGTFFSNSKQYEFIVVDSNTLQTTVDSIPIFTGRGSLIVSTPEIVNLVAPSTQKVQTTLLRLNVRGGGVSAVVIGGNVVPSKALSSDTSGFTIVNLNVSGLCFGDGDVSVTVVRNGESDTTSVRFVNYPCQAVVPTVIQQ